MSLQKADVLLEEARNELQREIARRGDGERVPLLASMREAAEAFVDHAERRAAQGEPPINLDLALAFKGLVLEAATRRKMGDVRQAFLLLGKEATVKDRNHRAVSDREGQRVAALEAAVKSA